MITIKEEEHCGAIPLRCRNCWQYYHVVRIPTYRWLGTTKGVDHNRGLEAPEDAIFCDFCYAVFTGSGSQTPQDFGRI